MRSRRARIIASTALAAALVVTAAPAALAGILPPEDATELAQILADATEEQGVCYSWSADVYDENGLESSQQSGSSLGPDTEISPEAMLDGTCSQRVDFSADITYTSESSESEDYASMSVNSTKGSISEDDLTSLGYDTGDLLGDDDDKALYNLVAGLPLLAADAGIADPVPLEPLTAEEARLAATDKATDSPGSDWWRMYWWFALLVLAGVGALCYFVIVAVRKRVQDGRRDPRDPRS